MKPLHIHYFMPQGIGDVIMTIPVIKKIAEEKNTFFSISVKSEIEASVIRELCPDLNIDFIILQEFFSRSGTLIAFFRLVMRIRSFSPDVILTQFSVSSVKSSLTAFFSGVNIRVGWKGFLSFLNTHTLIPSGQHKIAENFKSVKFLDIDTENIHIEHPKINVERINLSKIQPEMLSNPNLLKIAISPGSQGFDKHKRWSHLNFSRLINKVLNNYSNIHIYLVGDEREKKLCDDIIEKTNQKENITSLAGKTTIPQLLYILSKIDLAITNCNGISHLACAANSPLIGLYGPTDYRVTGPISKNFVPITAGLDCSPCYRRDYRFGCDDPVCMEKISVDKVYQNITKYI